MKDFFDQNCILFKGAKKIDEQRLEFMPLYVPVFKYVIHELTVQPTYMFTGTGSTST